jgi:L-2-hydroxyglutarate oxidase LhgO
VLSDILDALVVGAGVVGLAIGKALAESYDAVCVVDRHRFVGAETSSRNSGVIHAGIYYPPGSLKATLCREGSQLLYDYCAKRQIPHWKTGKIIIAKDGSGLSGLNKILQNANANGVALETLGRAQIRLLEPFVQGDHGLLSPETGIVDANALMAAYVEDIENAGGFLALENDVEKIEVGNDFHTVWFHGVSEPVFARRLVNAAGLHSTTVAKVISGLASHHIPKTYFAKGCYFKLLGRNQPFSRLVYPLPDKASLGVHATLDLSGGIRFGPDVEWVSDPQDYSIDSLREVNFRACIAEYFPDVVNYELAPDYAGIRPKLVDKGAPAADFKIDGPATHGIPGLVNLFGIESPGLTSSLALAKNVLNFLK